MQILPNPVAQKQTEVAQRQAAVSAFTHKLQRDRERERAEKERKLKEFMERKAREVAMKQQQEKSAQLEAKTGPLKVKKAEMAKAREEAAERLRQEQMYAALDPDERGRIVDSASMDDGYGPQVVRIHDPEPAVLGPRGRVHREGQLDVNRPVQPVAPEIARAMDLEARIAARKQYDQHVRQMQAVTIQASLQQVHNEHQVTDLWNLALQLSARLGALQQQSVPPVPMQAWPDPRSLAGALPMPAQPLGLLMHPAEPPMSDAMVQLLDNTKA
ncbi:hypothetical protein GPECTOR_2g1286 [Gonium pectorale]|uniref:Uncharacterized protein n=1 Tax=Gonium pectorale TaxID=33097 RepID=A0A150H0P6_GONPE|nr:hypothetical protein GPECTOR_2g1286 [Gonium pectorale]|eukprot:KXZ55736.1 hypothetical protein GPECTOR_2g1286 [Gonium pectorale]